MLFASLFFLFAGNLCFGRGNSQNPPAKPLNPPDSAGEFAVHAEDEPEYSAGAAARPSLPADEARRAEEVMKALSAAYPERLGPAEFRNGDWAVPLREEWFYYAGGRLLPEELRERAAEYDPQPFYPYPETLPPWEEPGPAEAARYRGMAERRSLHPPKRSHHFYDALWRARSRGEAWDRVKSIRFLGRPVMVHYAILEELALVEERILAEARTNTQVRQWVDSLKTLDGWNWRSIADTQSRSFHAYGAALDLLPQSLGNRETYWIWAARKNPEWWTVPHERRFHPPEAVIRAFESYGFIWGGKWTFFDTMHFEYRPEILILNNLPISDLR
jgi:hypothetical protein